MIEIDLSAVTGSNGLTELLLISFDFLFPLFIFVLIYTVLRLLLDKILLKIRPKRKLKTHKLHFYYSDKRCLCRQKITECQDNCLKIMNIGVG